MALSVIVDLPETMRKKRRKVSQGPEPGNTQPERGVGPFRTYLGRIAFALPLFLLCNLRNVVVEIMIQYASKKFETPIDQVGVGIT